MTQPKNDTCHHCGESKKKLVKHLEDGTQTETIIYVCVNKECPFFKDVSKLKNWNAS